MTAPVIRRTATVLALLASAVFAALAFADTGPPTASFEYSPSAPLSSQDITFTSTSSDPDGPLASEDWDLDNDGQYDDASGSVAQTSFTSPGDHVVGLQVADGDGSERPRYEAALAHVEGEFDLVEHRESLAPLLAALPARERQILLLRFFGGLTQTEIGNRMGISQMHVSRLLARTLTQLRRQLAAD